VGDSVHIPIEPFLIIPFMVALWNRREKWDPDGDD
jgi:hypothetical protein